MRMMISNYDDDDETGNGFRHINNNPNVLLYCITQISFVITSDYCLYFSQKLLVLKPVKQQKLYLSFTYSILYQTN